MVHPKGCTFSCKYFIKFKKSYCNDEQDTLYINLKLNDLEFEMIKAKIAKDKKFVNL